MALTPHWSSFTQCSQNQGYASVLQSK
uniref:Uncharacterized protein n=1 Tax=Anguilla anguilla TaxID=7936 RepID=A0A0E9VWU3_ANGAN